MAFHDKFRLIRESKGLAQADVAKTMGVSKEYINNLETKGLDVDDEVLSKLKSALGVESDIPFTKKEIEDFRDRLNTWYILTNQSLMDEAAKMQPILEAAAKGSFDAEIQALYAWLSSVYYKRAGNQFAMVGALVYVGDNIKHLPMNHAYGYLTSRVNTLMRDGKYKEALRDFIYIEYLCEQMDIRNHAVYFNIAICCQYLGYSYKAKEYINKACEQIKESKSKYNTMHLDMQEAQSYRDTGRCDIALDILHKRLDIEKRNLSGNADIHLLYENIGYAYLGLKDYKKANEFLDLSLKHCVKNNVYYFQHLYYKCIALILSGSIMEVKKYIQEGLSASASNKLYAALFKALSHSQTLKDEESLAYIRDVAIPFFINTGRYREVIDYCERLSEHYAKTDRPELSDKYKEIAIKYNKKIIKGEVCHEESEENIACRCYGDYPCLWKYDGCPRIGTTTM